MVDSILSKLNNSKIVLFLQKYEKISNDGKWQKQTSKKLFHQLFLRSNVLTVWTMARLKAFNILQSLIREFLQKIVQIWLLFLRKW